MLNGKFRHKDTAGNEGYLKDGSVQWMTAGRGVIHSEMPEQTDGLVRGFQLWLNLPKEKKMIKPSYNDIDAKEIPIVEQKGASIKVIAGTYENITGPGNSHTGMLYFDISMNSNNKISIPIDDGWNGFCYVYEGRIFCKKELSIGSIGIMSTNGVFECRTESKDARFILVAGMPLNEPVARGGPFVMNTKNEVLQAFEDYQLGRLG